MTHLNYPHHRCVARLLAQGAQSGLWFVPAGLVEEHKVRQVGEVVKQITTIDGSRYALGLEARYQPFRGESIMWWRRMGLEFQDTFSRECPQNLRDASGGHLKQQGFQPVRVRVDGISQMNLADFTPDDLARLGWQRFEHERDNYLSLLISHLSDLGYSQWWSYENSRASASTDEDKVWIMRHGPYHNIGFSAQGFIDHLFAAYNRALFDVWAIEVKYVAA